MLAGEFDRSSFIDWEMNRRKWEGLFLTDSSINKRLNMRLQQDAKRTREFQQKLLRWYAKNRRPLPWRCHPTPYRIWISEIMLQQTQVKTVIQYYGRFLQRFPDIASLARSSEREIMRLWSGLGYYGRARNLHRAARQIVKAHNGVFPNEFETILALPGVGQYTAGAICSLAFSQAQPIVDGNIRRVITRLNGIRKHAPESYFWNQMTVWIPNKKASVFNQAMMELGALVCVPSTPRCPRCPVRNCCKALRMGLQDIIPRPRARQAAERVEIVILVLERKDKILLARQPRSFIPGEWGLPVHFLHAQESPQDAAARLIRKIFGSEIAHRFFTKLRHSISNRRVLGHVFGGNVYGFGSQTRGNSSFRWVNHTRLNAFLTSSLFRKVLQRYRE